jgi:molybdopterin converting factor small subunit
MKVSMFGTLRTAIGGVTAAQVHVTGTYTAREALVQLATTYPGLRARVLGEGQELQRGVNLFVGGRSIRLLDGLNTLLEEGDELVLLPLLGGA